MTRLRLQRLESRLTPATTADQLVQPAGEFNWLQATPDGGLMELVYKGGQLTSRDRVGTTWVDQDVTPDDDNDHSFNSLFFRESIEGAAQQAQLLITPDGTAHAFVANFAITADDTAVKLQLLHYVRPENGHWQAADPIPVADVTPFSQSPSIGGIAGAVAADGSLHLVVTVGIPGGSALHYVTNKSGSWTYEAMPTPIIPKDFENVGAFFEERYLSVAVDSADAVHVTYTPQFISQNFGTVYSALNYATNRGGSWTVEQVYAPPDGTGDAGLAASIAIGPDNQPAIASYFVDRVPTGSPASAQLLYSVRTASGWQPQVVASQSDNYSAADGTQYTGFSPLLQFDGGVPVVTFEDIAAQHIDGAAREYSGQIRTATLTPGGWQLATVFRQTNPLANLLFYPVRTVVAGTPVYGGLTANYAQDANGLILDDTGTYQLLELNAPNIPPKGPDAGTPGGPLGAGVVGADAGGGPVVRVYNAAGTRTLQLTVFDPSFPGGVRVAAADFNGDGTPDIVAGTGPGIATEVRVLDGVDGHELFSVAPFEASFTGGVYVTAGDVTGDGVPDLAITPDEGGGPRVDVYSGAGFGKVASFFGIDDVNFRGGARASIGDLNADGRGDLIVVAGFGGGPRVAAFDGTTLTTAAPQKLFGDFFAFEQTLRNGIFVTAADLDGDGYADLIAGGGPGGGPRVTAFSGKSLMANQYVPLANFFAGETSSRGGVRLAARDVDGDGKVDVLAGVGADAGSHVTAYRGSTLAADDTTPLRDFDAFQGFGGGVFVG